MLPIEILENIKEDDVIVFYQRLQPIDPPIYFIDRVIKPRANEHNCNSIVQDILLIKGYHRVDYSKIVKICDKDDNIYLLFSYLENLELEMQRATELRIEYSDKMSISISPRDDFNNAILNEALCDYISSHNDIIKSVKHQIDRELNLLKKR